MNFVRKSLAKAPTSLVYSMRRSSGKVLTTFEFSPKFTKEEEEKVLNTLNQSNKDQLLGFNMSQARVKNMESYIKKKGPFQSLEEILEVDGLGVKLLEKLCEQIIADAPNTLNKKPKNGNKKTNLLSPRQLPTVLNSSVAIHLAPMGVSWAKLTSFDSQLESWGFEDLGLLPKKLSPTDTYFLAADVLQKLPLGDVYVFEGTPSRGPGGSQSTAVTSYNQQLELSSMLLALINTSPSHNIGFKNKDNCVYFLKSKLPARLFNTLVGNERVSATATISQILEGALSLPCNPISLGAELKQKYALQSPPHKELMGQALMLAVAFTDICVRQNPNSLKAIAPGRKSRPETPESKLCCGVFTSLALCARAVCLRAPGAGQI